MTANQTRGLAILATFGGAAAVVIPALIAVRAHWGATAAATAAGLASIGSAAIYLWWSCGTTRCRPFGAMLLGSMVMLPVVGSILDGWYTLAGVWGIGLLVLFGAAWPDYPPPPRRRRRITAA